MMQAPMGWYKPLNDHSSHQGFIRSHSAPAPVPFRNVTDPRANNPQPAGRKGFFPNALIPSCVTLPEGVAGLSSVLLTTKNVLAPLVFFATFYPCAIDLHDRLDGDPDINIAISHCELAFLCPGSARARLIRGVLRLNKLGYLIDC
jgi:hypothetical protein